jgi:hypothetical protein
VVQAGETAAQEEAEADVEVNKKKWSESVGAR